MMMRITASPPLLLIHTGIIRGNLSCGSLSLFANLMGNWQQ